MILMTWNDRPNRISGKKSKRRNDGLRIRLVKILREHPDGLLTSQVVYWLKESGWKRVGSIHQIGNVLRLTPGIVSEDTGNHQARCLWKIADEEAWNEYIEELL